MAKNFKIGIDFATQPKKGAPRDGDFKDRGLPSKAPRVNADAQGDGKGTDVRGTAQVIGKLG